MQSKFYNLVGRGYPYPDKYLHTQWLKYIEIIYLLPSHFPLKVSKYDFLPHHLHKAYELF